jgi:hypothetical protein
MLRATGVVCLLVANVVFHFPRRLSALEDKTAAYLATDYEKLASAACRNYSLASWDYQTDVDNKTKVEELVSKTVTSFAMNTSFVTLRDLVRHYKII